MFEKLARWRNERRLKKILKSNRDGWLLVQRGNQYHLQPVTHDPDADAMTVDWNDSKEYYEDHAGAMRTLHGIPFGLACDQARPVVDADAASKVTAVDAKLTDGGDIANESLTWKDVIQRFQVGYVDRSDGRNWIVNPFHLREDEDDIVDIRPTMRLFRHASSPDTPRKAAKNAVEAERANAGMDFGSLMQIGTIFGAFFLGAITVEYIAGGSGGSSVIDGVGLMILPYL